MFHCLLCIIFYIESNNYSSTFSVFLQLACKLLYPCDCKSDTFFSLFPYSQVGILVFIWYELDQMMVVRAEKSWTPGREFFCCCSASLYLVFMIFFLQSFGCWSHFSPTDRKFPRRAIMLEDILHGCYIHRLLALPGSTCVLPGHAVPWDASGCLSSAGSHGPHRVLRCLHATTTTSSSWPIKVPPVLESAPPCLDQAWGLSRAFLTWVMCWDSCKHMSLGRSNPSWASPGRSPDILKPVLHLFFMNTGSGP